MLRKSILPSAFTPQKSYQFDPNLIFTDELSVLNKSFKRECFVASPVYLDLLVCLTEPYLWVRKSQALKEFNFTFDLFGTFTTIKIAHTIETKNKKAPNSVG